MDNTGFWKNLKLPIIGLSPMDGVTDAVFRYMLAKHKKPSVIFTEFTNVEGLARGAEKMLTAFLYDEIERPIVAQLFGTEVNSFYKCAVMLCKMGVDGIDINMGCPAKNVINKGGGGGLIKNPKLAQKIIRSVKKGIKDWQNGITMEKAGVHKNIIATLKQNPNFNALREKSSVAVSVKTRISFDEIISKEWIKYLLEEEPATITMHGRTLKQMYKGEADWETLREMAKICKKTNTFFLGNGDIKTLKEAKEKIKKYDLDGVLIGRATMGNPWFFMDKDPSVEERILAVKEHCENFQRIFKDKIAFYNIKKHLTWYLKGFEGVKELRMKLMQTNNFAEVEEIMYNSTKDMKIKN